MKEMGLSSTTGTFTNLKYGFLCLALALVILASGCSGVSSASSNGGGSTPLTISNLTAGTPSQSIDVISWQTSNPANSQVEYGTSTAYGSTTPLDSTMVTSHQVTLSNLQPSTLYHFRAHSTDASGQTVSSPDGTFTTAASSDTTPPTVSITAPANGATVSGTVSVTASASDNVGVASVQFQVDGANVGTLDTTAPYGISWDTTKTPNGSHSLRAIAKDAAGNSATSAVVTVSVSNATADTTPPVVTVTAPANNATVSGTISLTANATDPDSSVSFVQFQVDGSNVGSQLTSAPYSMSLDTTTLANGTHSVDAFAKDPAGNQGTSLSVTITVSNATNTSMGPLKQSTTNTRYFINPAGNAVFLAGSHTWDDFQDTDTSGGTPAGFDFNAFVNFLKSHGQNATILWRKDLPEYCDWNFTGSVWRMAPWPWLRPGPGIATDGNPKFDLTQFNQAYFDRLRSEVQLLQQNGIYAIVELFDANQLTSARCSTDGYPFTGANNINGVDDGYSTGSSGVASVTMTAANSITNFQDAYVKKVIDTLNDLPNVVWEVAEEQPGASMTWWAPHVMSVIRTYESSKPYQHPVGIGALNYNDQNDGTLYASPATWVAPTINATSFPANVAVNNQGKVAINDSDHSLFWKAFTNSDGSIQDQNLRGYLWENLASGAAGVVFMDPYVIYWPSTPNRNLCLNPVSQICTGGLDSKYENFRSAMGYLQKFANANLNLQRMTPQGTLSSTGFCLADNSATGAEYVVYAPTGGQFTINLSATTRVLNVEWLNPATGAMTSASPVTGGSTLTFTPPFSGDAVLYLVDSAGHN